jgi:hypothetical protein
LCHIISKIVPSDRPSATFYDLADLFHDLLRCVILAIGERNRTVELPWIVERVQDQPMRFWPNHDELTSA